MVGGSSPRPLGVRPRENGMAISVSSLATRAQMAQNRAGARRPQPASFSGLRATSAVHMVGSSLSADEAFAARTSSVAVRAGSKQVTEAKARVAINGFGRIGRMFLRCLHKRGNNTNLEVVAVNDSAISVDGKLIKVVSGRDPEKLPWKDLKVDIVIEGTGVFCDMEGAGKHLKAGAKKVVITAPAKDKATPTFVVGVNEGDLKPDMHIVSNASCTTNCLAPFVKIMHDKFGIVKGTMTTPHSYTGDQRLLDASHRDLRRARAAALNIVPTSTGAAKAVAQVLPALKGKLNGIALRVPTPTVSIVDLVCQVEKKTMAEEVNQAFRDAANGPMKGVLAITDTPLVSMDFKGTDVSTTIDAALTMVMGDDMVKVVAWYDNEWGYSQRVVDLTELVSKHI